MKASSYTPKPGSVAATLIACLQRHRGQALTTKELSAASGITSQVIASALGSPLAAGVVRRDVDTRTVRWRVVIAETPQAAPAADPAGADDPDDWPTQRVVPAADAPPPPARGAASVFALGKPAAPPEPAPRAAAAPATQPGRSRLPPLQPDAIEIIRGVPVPPIRTHQGSVYLVLLKRMQPGDSVCLGHAHAKSLVSTAKKSGIRTALRRASDDHSSVWRLS